MDHAVSTATSGRPGRHPAGERAFSAQLGAKKSTMGQGGKSFLRSVSVLVAKRAGRRAGVASQTGRGAGRGASGAHPSWKYQQRVVVKARVVRNRGAGGRGTLKDHLRYLERDGVDEEGGKGQAFGADDTLTPSEVEAFAERGAEDRHHFRFIVSPEHGSEIDLPTYTRELMLQAEADLGSELDWVAVAHYNTDNPHVHIIVRGADDRGADLVMSRDYISQGLRGRAQDIATRELGPRRESEIDQELAAELKAMRATRLDRVLAAEALEGNGLIDVRPPREREPDFREKTRLQKITRLHTLETLGLANEVQSGRWEMEADAVERLTRMARRAELVAELNRHAGPRFEFRDISVYDKTAPEAPQIQGEVVGRGKLDELAEHDHLYVAGNVGETAGKVFRVPVSVFAERAEAPIRRGQIVTLSVQERRAVTAADENILKQAAKDGGLYSAERHYQWTKATNERRSHPIEDVDEYLESHVRRIEGHSRRGFVEPVTPGVWRVPTDLIDQLEAHARAQRDRGGFVRIDPASTLTLDEQIEATGPTWLDQQLARGKHLQESAAPGALTAERRLRAALFERVEVLEARGVRVAQQALNVQEVERLYRAEIAEVAQRLTPLHGKHIDIDEIRPTGVDQRRRIEGTLKQVENLASGAHAVVVNSKGFAVLPASQRTAEHVGKQVSVVIRDAQSRDATRPNAVQMRVRYAELERERERDLGRGR